MINVYRTKGAEEVEFDQYDRLIYWLWIHVKDYEIVKVTVDYTNDIPSKKLITYHMEKIR